ncbi:co-chaperone GroES [bacterium]|nr:co-chaperone GroES [bacterium]
MNVKPLSDRVLVRPIDQDTTARGGIIIPDTAKERPQEGEIIAVGPGRTSDSGELIVLAVKAGQKVLYGKYAGTEITIEGDEYLIMQESNILAILE